MGLQIPRSHPKYRKRVLYGKVKRDVGEILRDLAPQKMIDVLEGHLMPDHVHMCLKIPPKHSVAFALGFMKGKSAVRIYRKEGYKKVTGLPEASRYAGVAYLCLSLVFLKYLDHSRLKNHQPSAELVV
jgi:REP element-mobilizing transposase RayT